MLAWRGDAILAVVALKSLLRFCEGRCAVTITDDGSLSHKQRTWISWHIPNVRFLPRRIENKQLTSILKTTPLLAQLYYGDYHPICKLIHPLVLSMCNKVIILDPDTAFFKSPDLLLSWIDDADNRDLFLHDKQNEKIAVPYETIEAFDRLRLELNALGKPWSMPYYFFNSGLLAYRVQRMDIQIAELYLKWLKNAPEKYKTGKPGLWFGPWTPEQTAYQLMFATMHPAPCPLGEQYRIGNSKGYTFNHFLGLQITQKASLKMLQDLIYTIRGHSIEA